MQSFCNVTRILSSRKSSERENEIRGSDFVFIAWRQSDRWRQSLRNTTSFLQTCNICAIPPAKCTRPWFCVGENVSSSLLFDKCFSSFPVRRRNRWGSGVYSYGGRTSTRDVC